MSRSKGLFITLEGIDGCGKSTQSARLSEWLTRKTGRDTIRTFEPGGYPEGMRLREFLLENRNLSPMTELLLFLADRAEHAAKVIAPALENGRNVVCERWNESTMAYQSSPQVKALIAACSFPEPDAKIFLDVEPELAASRLAARAKMDKFEEEGLTFMKRVAERYRALDMLKIPCGELGEDGVFALIVRELEGHLWPSR